MVKKLFHAPKISKLGFNIIVINCFKILLQNLLATLKFILTSMYKLRAY